jgi:hypothetical protein
VDFIDLLKAMDAPIGIIVLFLLAAIRRDVKAQHKRLNRIEHRLFPAEDDTTPPQGPGIVGGAAALLFVGLLILPGCTLSETRSTSSSSGTLSGTIDGKPVELAFVGGSEAKATQSVDSAALAASVGKAVGATVAEAVKAAVPGAAELSAAVKAVLPPPPADDGTAKVIAGGGAAATALSLLLAALKAREAARHRADADDAWDRLAPPSTAGASAAPRGQAQSPTVDREGRA